MIQCGDWGYFIGRELGSKYTDSCKLLHFNFAPSPLPEGAEYTEREKAVAARVDDWITNHIGYAICMRTSTYDATFSAACTQCHLHPLSVSQLQYAFH